LDRAACREAIEHLVVGVSLHRNEARDRLPSPISDRHDVSLRDGAKVSAEFCA
jgi:hypothetical protein